MLITRILSALVLLAAALSTVWLPPFYVQSLVAVLLLVALWEFSRLLGLSCRLEIGLYAISGLMVYLLTVGYGQNVMHYPILLSAALIFMGIVAGYSLRTFTPDQPVMPAGKMTKVTLGIWGMLGIQMTAQIVVWLHTTHLALLGLLIMVVAVTDTGAYCFGRLWGKRKLAPEISPGKTWVGLYGGVATAWLAALVSLMVMQGLYIVNMVVVSIAVFIVSPASVVGDLFESLLKRRQGIKDSGMFIPGHGGVMDRIDGFMLATPTYALMLHFYLSYLDA